MSDIERTKARAHTLQTRRLTDAQFLALADVPPEVEWFANLDNENTRVAYRRDVRDFMQFVGISEPTEFRHVTRSHVIHWRDQLKELGLAAATIRRKLSAVSSLYDYLCENNAVEVNPTQGVKRPDKPSKKTPAIGDAQARALLAAPPDDTLKGQRDRAILSVFLFHALRRSELVKLTVRDVHEDRGVTQLRVHGKGDKLWSIPAAPQSLRLIDTYLEAAGHKADKAGPLFRPVTKNSKTSIDKAMTARGVLTLIKKYADEVGVSAVDGFCVHALRATAITNALEHEADIAKVQEWVGHSKIDTTRGYDRRTMRPEDSPTFRVRY